MRRRAARRHADATAAQERLRSVGSGTGGAPLPTPDEPGAGDRDRAGGCDRSLGWVPAEPVPAGADRPPARHLGGALAAASVAYSAAYGHPLSHDDPDPTTGGSATGRRWAVRPRVAAAASLVLVLLVASVLVWAARTRPEAAVPLGIVVGPSAVASASTGSSDGASAAPKALAPVGTTSAKIVVHVIGQVAAPGVVKLAAGARVAEAIEAAGGPTGEANLTGVNLARVLVDGEQVVVPRPGEEVARPAGAGVATAGPLDLNTASAAELDALPGIGPVLAQRIVDWRTANGRFTDVDELGEVAGIGPALLGRLRSGVRV